MAGAIYILQPERVHPVDVPLRKAMVCVTKWGAEAAEALRCDLEAGRGERGIPSIVKTLLNGLPRSFPS